MALSSPGIGSGLDVKGIVDQLVSLERRPVSLLQTAKTKLDTRLSSYGLLQSYMANLQSIAGKLSGTANWDRNTAASSDATAVAATATGTAVAGRYSIGVTALASSQSLSSAVFTDPTDLGTGTITVTRGGASVAIEIGEGQTSLQAVRDKINQANAGVSAAIVQDANGPLLVLTGSDTGSANAVSIGVASATGSLASLVYPGGLTERRPAADASFTVNGVPLSAPTNRLEGIVDGLNITLGQITSAPVEVTVSPDTAAFKKDVEDFVAAYNQLNRYLVDQTKYDPGSQKAGALQGDRTAVSLIGRLRSLVQQPSEASAVFGRLSDLGIALQRDGSLQVDATKLSDALANKSELAKAFSHSGNGLALGFKALADGMLGVEGALTARSDGLRDSIKRNERDQERLEDRIARVRERLLRQYSALDTTVNQLTGLNNLVTQQLTALSNFYKRDNY